MVGSFLLLKKESSSGRNLNKDKEREGSFIVKEIKLLKILKFQRTEN